MEPEVKAFDRLYKLFEHVFGAWQDWPSDLQRAWDIVDSILDFALQAKRLGATPRIAYVVYEGSASERRDCFYYELTEDERKVFVALWRWRAREALIDPDELFQFLPEAKNYL